VAEAQTAKTEAHRFGNWGIEKKMAGSSRYIGCGWGGFPSIFLGCYFFMAGTGWGWKVVGGGTLSRRKPSLSNAERACPRG